MQIPLGKNMLFEFPGAERRDVLKQSREQGVKLFPWGPDHLGP